MRSGSSAKRPSATAAASTTATTPSTVSFVRKSGQSKAFTSGFGRASPEVSITMWSGLGSRASNALTAGAKSSATVQQMHPLASSMIASRGQASSAQPLSRSPSTPTSPNSLMMSASRRPPAWLRIWRMRVVLPAPRKPVTMVTGVLASIRLSLSGESGKGRRARHDPLAEGERALAPGDNPVGGGGVAARRRYDVFDVRLAAEVADDIGPFAGRGERDSAGPLADGEALDRLERDRFGGHAGAERLIERRPHLSLVGLAGHADEKAGPADFDAHGGVIRRRQGRPAGPRGAARFPCFQGKKQGIRCLLARLAKKRPKKMKDYWQLPENSLRGGTGNFFGGAGNSNLLFGRKQGICGANAGPQIPQCRGLVAALGQRGRRGQRPRLQGAWSILRGLLRTAKGASG